MAKISTKQSGFTLIETFVALTILVIAILGPLSMFARAIMDSNYAKNQVIAFYLAQEGLEMVNNIKDNNAKNNQSWLIGLEDCMAMGVYCNINPLNLTVTTDGCTTNPTGCALAKRDNLYLPTTGSTFFRRGIRISNLKTDAVLGDREATIESTVLWNNRGKWQSTVLVTHIFNY